MSDRHLVVQLVVLRHRLRVPILSQFEAGLPYEMVISTNKARMASRTVIFIMRLYQIMLPTSSRVLGYIVAAPQDRVLLFQLQWSCLLHLLGLSIALHFLPVSGMVLGNSG